MATMASTTTRSRAAAISTAAVGLSPKMVVRSLTDERGSAEAPSSRRVSVVTVPLVLPLAPGAGVVTAGLSVWVVELLEDEEPDADGADGVAGLAGLAGLVELELLEPVACARVSVTGAASTATPSRATSKDFIPHLLGGKGSKGGAIDCTPMRRAQ
jgi:hypothetical protein